MGSHDTTSKTYIHTNVFHRAALRLDVGVERVGSKEGIGDAVVFQRLAHIEKEIR